jgi:hypothetical protein
MNRKRALTRRPFLGGRASVERQQADRWKRLVLRLSACGSQVIVVGEHVHPTVELLAMDKPA